MSNIIEMKETQMYQTIITEAALIGWDLTPTEADMLTKISFNGITDYLALTKNKGIPQVVLVQDIKGNNIAFGCAQYAQAEDNENEEDGSWEYFWSFNTEDIPENAAIYTIDNEAVQKVIAKRGHNMCRMVVGVLNYLSIITVIIMNAVHDTLDQQNVANGESFTLDLPGFYEASVAVENGEKVFSIAPKEEMKVLIKDDTATVAAENK